jgi:hypothetical protein
MRHLEEIDEDAEVRLAHQPSWPFEYGLHSWNPVVLAGGDPGEEIVYIVEGRQIGYLPGEGKEACGW